MRRGGRLVAAGVLVAATGLLWIGQGLGWIMWPRDSFMLGEPIWSWRGAALAGAGAILIYLGMRRR